MLHLWAPGTHSPVQNTLGLNRSLSRDLLPSAGFFCTVILIYDDGVGTHSVLLHHFFKVVQHARGHVHRATCRKKKKKKNIREKKPGQSLYALLSSTHCREPGWCFYFPTASLCSAEASQRSPRSRYEPRKNPRPIRTLRERMTFKKQIFSQRVKQRRWQHTGNVVEKAARCGGQAVAGGHLLAGAVPTLGPNANSVQLPPESPNRVCLTGNWWLS